MLPKQRTGGILLHITSLPSRFGVGDLGPQAYAFADFLKKAGAGCWQTLPLNYTTAQTGFSPYNCVSVFAGNPLLISPELLLHDGLLQKSELEPPDSLSASSTDFAGAARFKHRLLNLAFKRFRQRPRPAAYESFVERHRRWLEDFAFFAAFQKTQGRRPWPQWPAAVRLRRKNAIERFRNDLRDAVEREMFIQFIFARQYADLKRCCNKHGILLFGDLPIYTTANSADVWANPTLFKLRRDNRPRFIAGVPPDYFSSTGQLWGNPVYDWGVHARTGYRWWLDRLEHNLNLFDILRIDHFRGLEAYWQVPAGHKTAARGAWVKGPGEDFFNAVFRRFTRPSFVAEDLGYITPGVRALIERYDIPCMKVLQFAFNGEADNVHLPHHHLRNSVVYTGTHDNNTTAGWYKHETSPPARRHLAEYLGKPVSQKTVVPEMLRLAAASPAQLCVIPMQDVLELGAAARMNNPASQRGNWRWRMPGGTLRAGIWQNLRRLFAVYGRCQPSSSDARASSVLQVAP